MNRNSSSALRVHVAGRWLCPAGSAGTRRLPARPAAAWWGRPTSVPGAGGVGLPTGGLQPDPYADENPGADVGAEERLLELQDVGGAGPERLPPPAVSLAFRLPQGGSSRGGREDRAGTPTGGTGRGKALGGEPGRLPRSHPPAPAGRGGATERPWWGIDDACSIETVYRPTTGLPPVCRHSDPGSAPPGTPGRSPQCRSRRRADGACPRPAARAAMAIRAPAAQQARRRHGRIRSGRPNNCQASSGSDGPSTLDE